MFKKIFKKIFIKNLFFKKKNYYLCNVGFLIICVNEGNGNKTPFPFFREKVL